MSKGRAVVSILALSLLTGACGAPRIDGSSPEKLAQSIQRASAALPEDQREKFSAAVMTISTKDLIGGGLMSLAAKSPQQVQAEAASKLNGKTAAEVIAEAAAIRAEVAAKERAQVIAEIKELEDKKAGAVAARAQLAKFEVNRSRFRQVPQRFGGPEPVINLTVRNGTSAAISRAYFVGTVATPGRSVPWIRESFNYQIAGGLEPGETAEWSLAPNQFSPWGKTDVPAGAVLTIDVVKLDGPDGKVLYDAEFGVDDEKRLARLKEQVQ